MFRLLIDFIYFLIYSELVLRNFVNSAEGQKSDLLGPLTCSEHCSGSNDIVKFQSNRTYLYAFKISHKLESSWVKSHRLTEELRGRMELTTNENCLFTLKITELSADSANGIRRSETASTMRSEQNQTTHFTPVQFCYYNGRISDFQSVTSDYIRGTNLRGALLSQLQVSAESLELPTYTTERDILGDCVTEYYPKSLGSAGTVFSKVKHSTGCSQRLTLNSALSTVEDLPPSHSGRIPFTEGNVQCQLHLLTNGTLMASQCMEVLTVRTTNSYLGGQPTTVSTEVELHLLPTPYNNALAQPQRSKRISQMDNNGKPKVMQLVLKMEEELTNLEFAEGKFVTKNWYNFVEKLRSLDASGLELLQRVILTTSTLKVKRLFTDALSVAGTETAFNHLINNAEQLNVGALDKIKALLSITTPTLGMLQSMRVLIGDNMTYVDSVHQVTILLQKLCPDYSVCTGQSEIDQVIRDLVSQIPLELDYNNITGVNMLVFTLRALGNIGNLLPEYWVTRTIEQYLHNKDADCIIKLAAVQLARRVACPSDIDAKLWDLITNPAEDSEVRITTYQVYARCVTREKLLNLTSWLNDEVSQQVGSYVHSHLTSHQFERDPLKQMTRHFESEIASAGKRFLLNPWSYSKYHEWNFPTRKGILTLQLNIIFGPESFIPRSIGFNITITAYGHSVNIMELIFRTTSQRHLEKALRHVTQSFVTKNKKAIKMDDWDEFEKQFAEFKPPNPISSLYMRIGENERIYAQGELEAIIRDFLKRISGILGGKVREDDISLRLESTLRMLTIGGVQLNHQFVVVGLEGNDAHWSRDPDWTINMSHANFLQLKESVQLDCMSGPIGISHEHGIHLMFSLNGMIRINYKPNDVDTRFVVNPWKDEQTLFNYERANFVHIGSTSHEEPDKLTGVLSHHSSAALDKIFGLDAVVLIHREAEHTVPNNFTVIVHHFYGLEQQIQWQQNSSAFGSLKRLYLLFRRPGKYIDEQISTCTELSFMSDYTNANTKFVHLNLSAPWGQELQALLTIKRDGVVHATVNFAGTRWELNGVHRVVSNQNKFTAHLAYPQGTAAVVYRSSPEGSANLLIYSDHKDLPFQLQLIQRFVNSRHQRYPIFHRTSYEFFLALGKNRSVNFQVVWNNGSRDGELRQGVLKLHHQSLRGVSDLLVDIVWMEGDRPSELDSTVQTYSRNFLIKSNLKRPGEKSSGLLIGLNQSLSHNFWMLHTRQPGIFSANLWTEAESHPQLNLQSSFVWRFGYQLDEGGDTKMYATLSIPARQVDALLQGELQWKNYVPNSVPWLKQLSGGITLRIFPTNFSDYVHANFSHEAEDDVSTRLMLSFNPRQVYSLYSYLSRGKRFHRIQASTPTTNTVITTHYRLQIGPSTAITLTQEIDSNHIPHLNSSTVLSYEFSSRKLRFYHLLNQLASPIPKLLLSTGISTEMHAELRANPFELDYVGIGNLQLLIPIWYIDIDFEINTVLQLLLNSWVARCSILSKNSHLRYRNGVDFHVSYQVFPSHITASSAFGLYLPRTHHLRSQKLLGWDFRLNSSSSFRIITMNALHSTLGHISFYEKYRYHSRSETKMDGSFMLSMRLNRNVHNFTGLYANYNYGYGWSETECNAELQGEFTSSSSVGPGTPLKITGRLIHDGTYYSGTSELGITSQHLGYWTGYEMFSVLSKHAIDGLQTLGGNLTLHCQSIIGYRLLEGRGTRAIETNVEIVLGASGEVVIGRLTAGNPGMTKHNSVEFGLVHTETNFSSWLSVVALRRTEMHTRLILQHDADWNHFVGRLELDIPRIDFVIFVEEAVNKGTQSLFDSVTNLKLKLPNTRELILLNTILVENRTDSEQRMILGHATSHSNLIWLKNLELSYVHSSNAHIQDISLVGNLNGHYSIKINNSGTELTTLRQVQIKIRHEEAMVRFVNRRIRYGAQDSEQTEINLMVLNETYLMRITRYLPPPEPNSMKQPTNQNLTAELILPKYGVITARQYQQYSNLQTPGRHLQLFYFIAVNDSEVFLLETNYTEHKVHYLRLNLRPHSLLCESKRNFTLSLQLVSPINEENIEQTSVTGIFQLDPWVPLTEGAFQLTTLEHCNYSVNGDNQKSDKNDSMHSEILCADKDRLFWSQYRIDGSWNEDTQLSLLSELNAQVFELTTGLSSKKARHPNMYTFVKHERDRGVYRYSSIVKVGNIDWWNVVAELVHNSTLHMALFNLSVGPLLEGDEGMQLFILGKSESESILVNIQQGNSTGICSKLFILTNLPLAYYEVKNVSQLYFLSEVFNNIFSIEADLNKQIGKVRLESPHGGQLNGLVGVETVYGEGEKGVEHLHKFYMGFNSTITSLPSSHLLIRFHRESAEAEGQQNRIEAYCEVEVSDLLPRHCYNITITLSNTDGERVTVNFEFLNNISLNGILELRTYNDAYVFSHSVHRRLVGGITPNQIWNTTGHCELTGYSNFDCYFRLYYKFKQRLVALIAKPDLKLYSVQFAWDEEAQKLIGTTMVFNVGLANVTLQSPLRDLNLLMHLTSADEPSAATIVVNISSFPRSGHGILYAVVTVHYKIEQEDTSHWSWSAGSQLQSNILTWERIGIAANVSRHPQELALAVISFNGNTKPLEVVRIDLKADGGGLLHSKHIVRWNDFTLNLTGLHAFQRSWLKSDSVLWIGEERNTINFTIDPWNKMQLLIKQDVELLQQFTKNSSSLQWIQRVHLPGRWLSLSQQTHINLVPLQLLSTWTSLKGQAKLITDTPHSGGFHLEVLHNSSSSSSQCDLELRIHQDVNNTLHAVVNWKPGFLSRLLFNGTELTDKDHMKRLLEHIFNSLAHALSQNVSRSYPPGTALVDFNSWHRFKSAILKELQIMADTLKQWRNEDFLYLETLRIPLINWFSEQNFSAYGEEITSSLQHSLQLARTMIAKCKAPNASGIEQIGSIGENYYAAYNLALERSTRDILYYLNVTFDVSKKMVHQIFVMTVNPIKELFALKTNISLLAQGIFHQFTTVVIRPFMDVADSFASHLIEQVPSLEPMQCYIQERIEAVRELFRQCSNYVTEWFFNSTPDEERIKLTKFISAGKFEKASQLFFRPELSNFKANLEDGLLQFSVYVPPLIQRWVSLVASPSSVVNQALFWLYPKQGMRSIMYAYDQYQRNFDLKKRLESWMPPYEVNAWISIGPNKHMHLVTFNGLFLLIPKTDSTSYLLLRDVITKLIRIRLSVNLTSWETAIEFGGKLLLVTDSGQIGTVSGSQKYLHVLPYAFRNGSSSLSVSRAANQITVEGKIAEHDAPAFSIQFHPKLQEIHFRFSGQWHGKCRGLLGSQTFDQLDEFRSPNGSIFHNLTESAKMWSYRNSATPMDRLVDVSHTWSNVSDILRTLCADQFSSLLTCDSTISSQIWLKACETPGSLTNLPPINASAENATSSCLSNVVLEQHICRIVRGYVQQCNRYGISIRVPTNCVQCDQLLYADGLTQVTSTASPATSVRVTFVLQLKLCFQERKEEVIQLVESLERANLTFTYLAVVFDGSYAYQEASWLSSSSGNINMTKDEFLRTLNAFIRRPDMLRHTAEPSEEKVLYDALQVAIRQTATNKPTLDAILLYMCGNCEGTSASYMTIQRLLKRKGIMFHYLPSTPFKSSEGMGQTAFMLGPDDQLYELDGVKPMRRANAGSVIPPRDQCSIIAQQTNGYIWACPDANMTTVEKRAIVSIQTKVLTSPVTVNKRCWCRDNLQGQGMLDCTVNVTPMFK